MELCEFQDNQDYIERPYLQKQREEERERGREGERERGGEGERGRMRAGGLEM